MKINQRKCICHEQATCCLLLRQRRYRKGCWKSGRYWIVKKIIRKFLFVYLIKVFSSVLQVHTIIVSNTKKTRIRQIQCVSFYKTIKTNLRRVAQRQSTVGLNSPSIFICWKTARSGKSWGLYVGGFWKLCFDPQKGAANKDWRRVQAYGGLPLCDPP